MDEHRWAPSVGVVVIGWLAAAMALSWCLLDFADAAGRLLSGVAALVLGVASVFGTFARPRLAADQAGLSVRGLRGVVRYPWAQVTQLRLVRTRRFGRNVPTLEIEVSHGGTDRLMVFGSLELGADPEDVVDALHALRCA